MDIFSFSDLFFRYCLSLLLVFSVFTVSRGPGDLKQMNICFILQFTEGKQLFVAKIPTHPQKTPHTYLPAKHKENIFHL